MELEGDSPPDITLGHYCIYYMDSKCTCLCITIFMKFLETFLETDRRNNLTQKISQRLFCSNTKSLQIKV